jgi:hypothetical protein
MVTMVSLIAITGSIQQSIDPSLGDFGGVFFLPFGVIVSF